MCSVYSASRVYYGRTCASRVYRVSSVVIACASVIIFVEQRKNRHGGSRPSLRHHTQIRPPAPLTLYALADAATHLSLGEAQSVRLGIALHEAHEAIPLVGALHDDDTLDKSGLAVREGRRHLRRLHRALAVL